MASCSRCGAGLDEGANYCGSCGAPANAHVELPVQEESHGTTYGPSAGQQPELLKWFMIGAVGILLTSGLVIGIGAVILRLAA